MRKRQKENSSVASFQYLKVFLLGVVILIFVALGMRAFTYIQESTFVGDHFVFLVISSEWYLVAIDRQQAQVNVVKLNNVKFDANWRVEKLSYEIGIPIDAVIHLRNKKTFGHFYPEFFSSNMLSRMVSRAEPFSLEGANTFDLLKIYFAALSSRVQNERVLSFAQDKSGEVSGEVDEIFSLFISDSRLKTENVSIEVVNSSGINGVGKRVAKLLTRFGFHVVSVTSSEVRFPSQITFRAQKNYTVERLVQIFHLPSFYSSGNAIADVTIVIGADYVEKIK